MSDIEMSPAELAEMFGGEVQPVEVDAQEVEVGLALQSIRGQITDAAERAKVGTVKLAERLGIAPSAVSRYLGGEGDMKVSTAVLYARALGHRWHFSLLPDEACSARGNHQAPTTMSLVIGNAGTTTSATTECLLLGGSSPWTMRSLIPVQPSLAAIPV
jgi:hypothetical protein